MRVGVGSHLFDTTIPEERTPVTIPPNIASQRRPSAPILAKLACLTVHNRNTDRIDKVIDITLLLLLGVNLVSNSYSNRNWPLKPSDQTSANIVDGGGSMEMTCGGANVQKIAMLRLYKPALIHPAIR
jgi:hypothetical protein